MTDGFAPLQAFMSACRERLGDNFERWLPGPDSPSPQLAQAMRYAVTVGGKRIRPILVYAAAELAGQGFRMIHETKTEPWGQTIARFLGPEGLLIGLCTTPWLHENTESVD